MLTLDLHLHTTFSDGKLPPGKIVDLCGNAGFDAIAITDHLCPLKLPDASSQTYYLLKNWQRYEKYLDLCETANARTFWRQMLKSPFSLIASSDLHSPGRWPAWRTQIPCAKDPAAIKEYLKNPRHPRDFVFIYGRKDEVKNRVGRYRHNMKEDLD